MTTDTTYFIERIQANQAEGKETIDRLSEFVPLFQTAMWVGLALYIAYFFREEIRILRTSIGDRLKGGSAFELGLFKLGEELKSVKDDLDLTNQRIVRLFITTMGLDLYQNLKKMASGEFGNFQKSKGLVRELYYLRDMGYIDVASITNIPESGDDLSKHLKVTNLGKEFIDLREKILNDHN